MAHKEEEEIVIRSSDKNVDGKMLPKNEVAEISKAPGKPLPENVKASLELEFNSDFSDVRVHEGQNAFRLSESLNASAFSYGNHIFFRPGEYDPNTQSGRKLLGHELAHVMQQRSAAKTK